MFSKKWIIIITFIITLVMTLLILQIDNECFKIEYDIALAVFGGSSMGFIMTLVEYFSERRKAMEQFWCEANSVLAQLRNAKYIHFDEPKELVIACITENNNNKCADKYGDLTGRAMGIEKSCQAKKEYIQWLEGHIPMSFSEDDDQDMIFDEMYSDALEKNERILKEAILNYRKLSEISLARLDSAYGNLDFIFGNKSIRSKAHDDIYEKIRKIRDRVKTETFHFDLLLDNKGSLGVCAEKALAISHQLFSEEEKSIDGMTYRLVYQSEFDAIADSLEAFRAKIYIKAEKDVVEHKPVMGEVIHFEDERRDHCEPV